MFICVHTVHVRQHLWSLHTSSEPSEQMKTWLTLPSGTNTDILTVIQIIILITLVTMLIIIKFNFICISIK